MNEKQPVSAKISVVVPTYNSAEWIVPFMTELLRFMCSLSTDYEVIAVNDHSQDNTLQLLQQLCPLFSKLRVVNLTEHKGQHTATWTGMVQASGNLIVTIDDDGEFPPDQIGVLIDSSLTGKADITYGIPNTIRQGGVKTFLYRLYLQNLAREGKKRKSSFRAISKDFMLKVNTGVKQMPNMDIYFEQFNPNINFISVFYIPGSRGRYGFWGYVKALLTAIAYRKKLEAK